MCYKYYLYICLIVGELWISNGFSFTFQMASLLGWIDCNASRKERKKDEYWMKQKENNKLKELGLLE